MYSNWPETTSHPGEYGNQHLTRKATSLAPGRHWSRAAVMILTMAVLGIAVLARSEDVRPLRIVSGSMAPVVEPGDWVIVRDVEAASVESGDIVLFRHPYGSDGRAIKRIAAVAGDQVVVDASGVTVNGRMARNHSQSGTQARPLDEIVPAGSVFVMGDNTEASIDSRHFGYVPENEIVGEVMLAIPGATGEWLQRLAIVSLAIFVVGLIVSVNRRQQLPDLN